MSNIVLTENRIDFFILKMSLIPVLAQILVILLSSVLNDSSEIVFLCDAQETFIRKQLLIFLRNP